VTSPDKWIVDTKDLGGGTGEGVDQARRGIVRDVLSTEYDTRVKLHPRTPPVPER